MKRSSLPAPVLSRLIELDEQAQVLTRKIDDTERAIANARVRLTGGFQEQEEPNDLRKALDEMIADLPVIERRCFRTRHTLSRCKDFLDKLSDDAVLEPVQANATGRDLGPVQVRLKAAEDELKALRQVPTPSHDIQQRIERYCTDMARPKIYGIDKPGGKLEVVWPEKNLVSMLALFHGDAMAAALKTEVELVSNDPLPPEARHERIAELKREIDGLQRLAFALGADASDLPARVVLGVRVARPKSVEHRETAA